MPIYIVSSINAVIFVMNAGIMTNTFKMDWLEFKQKSGSIAENTIIISRLELKIDALTSDSEFYQSQLISFKNQLKYIESK